MMDEKKAVTLLLKGLDKPFNEAFTEALSMGVEALKKQILEKPVKDEYHHNCCPNCGFCVSYDEGWGEKYVPHCENCGQAIEWG